MAANQLDGKDNETGRFYNRRIDFRIHNLEQVPVRIQYEFPEFMESMRDKRLTEYYDKINGLSYRIEFVVLDQLYKGDLINKYPDSIIEKNPDSNNYIYCTGLFTQFDQALQHLSEIKRQGFADAKIIPYLDGIRLSNFGLEDNLLEKYPDLRNYMLYLN